LYVITFRDEIIQQVSNFLFFSGARFGLGKAVPEKDYNALRQQYISAGK
jgi:hypothetical protein